jgi:hypothetical protein
MPTAEQLLSTDRGQVIVLAKGADSAKPTALRVGYFDWSHEPQVFLEAKIGRTWVGLECDVEAFEATMGRDRTDEAVETGTASITVTNISGRYTDAQGSNWPINESTEIRLRLRHPTLSNRGEQIVWWGFVEEWVQEWDAGIDQIVISAIDGLGLLAEQGGALGWTAGGMNEMVPTRLRHLLSRVGVGALAKLYAESGATRLVNPDIRDQSVLEEAHLTALSDGGRFFAECDLWGFYFVYLNRERFQRPPIEVAGEIITRAASTSTERIAPDQARSLYSNRPGQDVVPLFSDMCLGENESPDALPYTDIAWRYRGWEIPSLVAVSNVVPPREYDRDGVELPPRWTETGAIVTGRGRRHNVVEYGDLRFTTHAEAMELASLYAEAMSKSAIDVSMLEVHPELDDRLFDVVTTLRQGDWVQIERNLQTDRILVTAVIEGITWELEPLKPGHPRWKVTYRLTALTADVSPIPPALQPPRPPGTTEPLPDALKVMDLDPLGSGSTFIERGHPFNLFQLRVTDPERADHEAFAYSERFGTVRLPLLAVGTYDAQNRIMRQFGEVPLGPGQWQIWVRDKKALARITNIIPLWIDEPDPMVVTGLSWNPTGACTFSYTDGRYPASPVRIFARNRSDQRELVGYNWLEVGTPGVTKSFTIQFNAANLPPGDWQFWLQDPIDHNRRTDNIEENKPTVAPTGLRLGPFQAPEYDEAAWDEFPIVCDPVPDAEAYIFEYLEVGVPDAQWRRMSETAPMATLRGNTSRNDQIERVYWVRVSVRVNGQESAPSPERRVGSGYAWIIRKEDFITSAQPGVLGEIVTLGQNLGVEIPMTYPAAPFLQTVNPEADFFVGTVVKRIEFFDLHVRTISKGVTFDLRLTAEDQTWPRRVGHVANGVLVEPVSGNPETPTDKAWSISQINGGFCGIQPYEGAGWANPAVPNAQPGNDEGAWMTCRLVVATGDHYVYLPPKYPWDS